MLLKLEMNLKLSQLTICYKNDLVGNATSHSSAHKYACTPRAA